MKDLAVLLPTYNGGSRLRQSVESCASADLPPERYALLVIDNCSSDASIEALPASDANGVKVEVFRNERNLGRVGNWNRGLELAETRGFRFAAFLFVGDTWAPNSSIRELLDRMQESDAVLGMAGLRIMEEGTSRSRDGARISIPGSSAIVNSRSLLEHAIRIGRLPFAPLQANVYRIFTDEPLRFSPDPKRALNTDIEATVGWLRDHPGRIALVSTPFLVWNDHSDRFFSKQDPWFVLLETRQSLRRASSLMGVDVDWKSANAVSLLSSAREISPRSTMFKRLVFFFGVLFYLRSTPGGLAIRKFVQFTLNKLLRKQSYVSLPRGSALLVDGRPHTTSANTPLLTNGL
jgi:glycosyltransferase involved in cell wall biosynthesis